MDLQKENEISESFLLEIIKTAWNHKWAISIIVIMVTSISVIYAFLAKESFSTVTVFVAKTGNTNNQNLANLASMAGISIGKNSKIEPSDYLDKIIQDKEFLNKILSRKWYYKGDSLLLHEILNIKQDSTKQNKEYYFEKRKLDCLRKSGVLAIKKDIRTGILSLYVTISDPILAYDINIYAISLLSDYIRNSLKGQAKEKREFIEERIKEVKLELSKNERVLANFKERNMASSSPKVTLEEMRLMRELTISQELYIQFQKQFELARVEELDDQTLLQVIQNPEIPIRRSKPNRSKIVITGFMFSCIIGIIFSYLVLDRKRF